MARTWTMIGGSAIVSEGAFGIVIVTVGVGEPAQVEDGLRWEKLRV